MIDYLLLIVFRFTHGARKLQSHELSTKEFLTFFNAGKRIHKVDEMRVK